MIVEGIVTDQNGDPVQGAEVFAVQDVYLTVHGPATTNSAGTYTLTGLNEGAEYHIVAQYEDGGSQYRTESNPGVISTTEPASAVIEDWERSTPLAAYSGDTAAASIVSDSFEGSSALEFDVSAGDSYTITANASDSTTIPQFPVYDETWEARVWFEQGNLSAGLEVAIQWADAELMMDTTNSNFGDVAATVLSADTTSGYPENFSDEDGIWLRWVITHASDGTIEAEVFAGNENVTGGTITAQGKQASEGAIETFGWRTTVQSDGQDNIARFDYAHHPGLI